MNVVEHLKVSGRLPTPKGVALAVLELSRRENATLGEVAHVVQTDPALSGRLIKLTNTASRISRPVVSVQEAVARQGMASVRQLALGFSLIDQHRDGKCEAFDYEEYWSHSLLMALAMQALGERVRIAASDEMFVCGLLAQVGKLALATAYPHEFNDVLNTHRADPGQALTALERQHLETDHLELGVALLSDWGIPRPFVEAIAHYEDAGYQPAPDSRASSLKLMLRLSHFLADLGLAEADRHPAMAKEWMAQATELDIPLEAAGAFIDEVMAAWKDWGELLSIRTAAVPTMAEMNRSQAASAEENAPLRILVADGNTLTRRRIMTLLAEEGGHVVYPADNGNEALTLAMDVLPHVIIAHHNLSSLSGPELCQALRETEEGRQMHILMMADDRDDARLTQAHEAGADGYTPSTIGASGLRAMLYAAQRLVSLQNDWAKDRAQLRQVAAELAVANRRLANAALTDLLTGLPNRRSAMDQLDQAWSAASRACAPLSIMLIDVDHFKRINDTYGHATGDIVLREVADILRAAARREDGVFRFGGEEFLVICPNTNLKSAMQSAERLRTALEKNPIVFGQAGETITASFGVAAREPSISSIDLLVRSADQSLYAAKEAGRNQATTRQRIAC